jgi:hypothetical protein
MPRDELTRAIARRLGFNRTGSRIHDRILQRISMLKRKGNLTDDNGSLFASDGDTH